MLLVCMLELTWMLPGSLLRYHVKWQAVFNADLVVHAFVLSLLYSLKAPVVEPLRTHAEITRTVLFDICLGLLHSSFGL